MAKLREFDDIGQIRDNILQGVMQSVQQRYPYENERYRLELNDLSYDRNEPASIEEQKKALLRGQSLNRRLKGTWRLVDKSTESVVDEKPAVVAHVPEMTNRGTFVYNGNEYTIANQMRLRPGVYTRRKDSGDLEAHFNILPGTGKAFRVHMEPQTGVFKMQVGQSHLPLYSILRAQGVTDDQLQKAWGPGLLNANRAKSDDRAVQKAYDKLVSKKVEGEDPAEGLAREMQKMELDSGIVANNLGDWFDGEDVV